MENTVIKKGPKKEKKKKKRKEKRAQAVLVVLSFSSHNVKYILSEFQVNVRFTLNG